MVKRVELLAPCGSYESFLAAVNAGADAVYLGGRQFGARAYAENFLEDELTAVIKEAHLFGVKVYLTVNTLVKEQEFSGLCDYMRQLYEAGLDGAIVQDTGVFCFLRETFPGLKLHASTQMTITGAYGAAYLKEMGCERIVPARELSLQEIREIKQEVPVEIEAFIHGAMCYCYSGQCLMSSMIGGRSGNRGRCAGPCRLPYRVAGKEGYYLSLKDMSTLEHIPELIEAGIDSFKIEGRMKKPEYVAGVVSVYRKYIDRYYAMTCGAARTSKEQVFRVESKDQKLLSDLYIRSETGNGYYEKKNGRDMLTLHKPGYNEADQALLKELREKYIHVLPKMHIKFFVRCRAGEPLYGEVRFNGRKSGKTDPEERRICGKENPVSAEKGRGEVCFSVSGPVTERADKRAVSREEIRGQLVRTGGTPFAVKECIVEAGENIFVPMGRIKALRRDLLQRIYEYYGAREPADDEKESGEKRDGRISERKGCSLTVLVQTREQFEAVFSAVDISDAGISAPEKGEDTDGKAAEAITEYLIVDADLLLEEEEVQDRLSAGRVNWGIKCPVILRESDAEYLRKLRALMEERKPEIVYCATIDAVAWVKSISYAGKIAGEASLYAWNGKAVSFWESALERISIPLELESREIRELCNAASAEKLEAPVYGRAPFMVSANCIKLSAGCCDKDRRKYTELTDRMGNIFPVYTNCRHCYNIIYNYLPTSYYEGLWMLLEDGIRAFRMEFTTESGKETAEAVQTFRQYFASELTGKDIGRTVPGRERRNSRNTGAEERRAGSGRNAGMSGQKKGKTAGMETTQGRFRRGVE